MRAIIFAVAVFAATPVLADNWPDDFACMAQGQKVTIHTSMQDWDGAKGFMQVGHKKAPLSYIGTGGTGTDVLLYRSDLSQSKDNIVLVDEDGAHFRYNNRSVTCSGK